MNIGTMMARIGVDTAPLMAARAGMKAFQRDAVARLGKVKRAVFSLQGAFVGMVGMAGMAYIAKSAVKTAMTFEQSMLTVKGVTRATADEFKVMTDIAKEMGETTEWTASQSANALQFLGMAGFKAMEATKALPGVLDLATAGNIELARAADIASNALTAMQLPVSELTKVNDVFVGTITRTNTNMEMMAESFKYAAPVGRAFGYGIEELSAMIGQLGNAGIQGSMAGTQLAFAMQKATKVAKELNIDSSKLTDVLQAMNDQGWSNERMLKAFGMRGGRAVLILKDMIPQIKTLTGELFKSEGESKKLADIMRTSLRVAFIELGSAIEGVAIKSFDVYKDELRTFVEDTTKYVREHSDEFIKSIDSIKKSIQDLYAIYQGLPEGVVGAAGAGIAGRIIFGSWGPAKWILLATLVDNVTKSVNEFLEMEILPTPSKALEGWRLIGEQVIAYLQYLKASAQNVAAGIRDSMGIGGAMIVRGKIDTAQLDLIKPQDREEMRRAWQTAWGGFGVPPKMVDDSKKRMEELLKGYKGYIDKVLGWEISKTEEIGRLALLEQQYKEEGWQKIIDARAAYEAQTWSGIQAGYWAEYNLAKEVEAGVKESTKNIGKESNEMYEGMKNAITGWASSFSSTLTDMLWGAELTFGKILESFGKMLTQMAIQQMIIAPMLAGPKGGWMKWLFGAKGFAVENGVQKFAKGTIVNKPTVFPMQQGMGLIGEAGPEGVLPLARTRGGDLGVKAEGTGANVTVNVINQTSQEVEAEQRGQPRFDGNQLVVDVILTDLNRRGPIFHGMMGARA